ncbi:MAG TPA: DUF6660 family protein [Parapedobacter sp.]|nr:DUF6660 family protein [Parapedobacter sp.]
MQYHCTAFLLILQRYMRVFFSILAIYMMAVFLMPCADRYKMEAFQIHNEAAEATLQGSHDHPDNADACSPFCLCNCCGAISGLVFHWNVISFSEIRPVEMAKPNPQYISLFIPRYIGEIWQPPKISV